MHHFISTEALYTVPNLGLPRAKDPSCEKTMLHLLSEELVS